MYEIQSDMGVAQNLSNEISTSANETTASLSINFSVTITTPTSEMQQAASLVSSVLASVSTDLVSTAQGFVQIAQTLDTKDTMDVS